MSFTRRDFLRTTALAGAGALALPQLGWSLPRNQEDRRLVLLFLDGGNDGLNTIIPHEDDLYHKARPKLSFAKDQVVRLTDEFGLHPELAAWRFLHDGGALSVIHGVGYDQPDLSHFTSRDIWHYGMRAQVTPESRLQSGWVGRAFESHGATSLPPVAMGTAEAPLLLKSSRGNGLTMHDLSSLQIERTPRIPMEGAVAGPLAKIGQASRDAYDTAEKLQLAASKIPAGEGYPDSGLGDRLRLAARLVRAENGPPVCWTKLGGFDTHALQAGTHASLLHQVGEATAAFIADLASDGTDRRTLLLIYSEFGRRVAENGSAGTDHGTAGPVFALGGGVQGGLHGSPPNLAALDAGNLRHTCDYRAVFSEAVRDWMGWSAAGLFDGAYADGKGKVGFLRA